MMNGKLIDMIPHNLKGDESIEAICDVLQVFLEENIQYEKLLLLYKNIDILPEAIINHLAYQLHVDFYDEDLPLETKRLLVKNSIRYHKYKGTPWAVEDLLKTMFSDTWLEEWFEYGGEPYFFKVFTKDRIKSLDKYEQFFRALNTAKNTRSWIDAFVVRREGNINIYTTATDRSLRTNTYYPFSRGDKELEVGISVGAFRRQMRTKAYSMNTIRDIEAESLVFIGGTIRRCSTKIYDFNRDGLGGFLS